MKEDVGKFGDAEVNIQIEWKSSPYRSWHAVGSGREIDFFERWRQVMLRKVFFIIKVKLVWVQAKHAHHAVDAVPLGLYHHFFHGLLHCYMVLMTMIVMYNDFFRLTMAPRYL